MPTIASDLLQRHIQTLVDDAVQWEALIADDIVWELAYAPSVGHPARLSGREEVIRHVTWFRGAVDNFRFFNLLVYPITDSEGAVAEVKAEGIIKSTGRVYRQDYVVFLRAAGGSELPHKKMSSVKTDALLPVEDRTRRSDSRH
jgi:ketosteroid isomerase-like protein